jgi:hypothetical protein
MDVVVLGAVVVVVVVLVGYMGDREVVDLLAKGDVRKVHGDVGVGRCW